MVGQPRIRNILQLSTAGIFLGQDYPGRILHQPARSSLWHHSHQYHYRYRRIGTTSPVDVEPPDAHGKKASDHWYLSAWQLVSSIQSRTDAEADSIVSPAFVLLA